MRPHRIIAVSAGVVALTLLPAGRLFAQANAQDWENKEISETPQIIGALRETKRHIEDISGLHRGGKLTREKIDKAYKELWATNRFDDIKIETTLDPTDPNKVRVTITVREYVTVEAVEFRGFNEITEKQLKSSLRLVAGEALNPFYLKQDRDYIRDQYLSKGYHFSSVEDSTRVGTSGGVVLTWTVAEGPMVSVDQIIFSGNDHVDESELRRFMITKENDRLFGIIQTGRNPFVERNLAEDVKRIKLYYQLEGWLDIGYGDNVFVRDLVFTENRTRVIIWIHIDEGRRYNIRSVRFQFDPTSRRVFPEDEIRKWLISKAGEPYSESNTNKDITKIREKYGERAYILTEVNTNMIIAKEAYELDLIYTIKENDKIYIGRLIIEGNNKTREEVFRREFTHFDFAPGEEYNSKKLQQGITRIRDRGWVDPQQGIQVRTLESDEPNMRDVLLEFKEGQTGSIRFAAGYSSAYGIMGILEFTQKNFDIADLPSSLDDLINGTGFAGGGQFFRIRLAPAVKRQSYSADFKEPYFYGYDFGFGVSVYDVRTIYESYTEGQVGVKLILDKRIEPLTLQLGFTLERIDMTGISFNAPVAVKELAGTNRLCSLTPALVYDTRDSIIFPTEGIKALLSFEYAGQVLPGDFDYDKVTFQVEKHFKLYETEGHLKHVFSTQWTTGWVHAQRTQASVPIIERFFAGGRESIRGFDFRGMGPHENGDPVGGEVYMFGTVEYSYPLFVEFLRGAFFYDIANLSPSMELLPAQKWRQTIGFGLRFLIPQLGNVPVKLDFGFPLTLEPEDKRQTVTFDIGALF
jgi:outer membrane protein assembly complex protein YaeT